MEMLNMHDDEKIMPKKFGGKENLPYLCSVLLKWYTNTANDLHSFKKKYSNNKKNKRYD